MRFFYFSLFIITLQLGLAQGSGNVLTYDGNSQCVDLGNIVAANCRTIEFWFKPTTLINQNTSGVSSLIARDFNNGDGHNTNEFAFYIPDVSWPNSQGNLVFYRRVGSGTYYAVTSNSNSWQANVWYHVAGVIDPVLGMQLYINGVLQNNTNPTTQPIQPQTGSVTDMITIGAWGYWGDNNSGSLGRHFAGDIDEVRFWTTPRTQTQIRDNMCRKINPIQTGLQGYYNFDTNAGTTLTDLTGNGYNGTLRSFPATSWHYSSAPIGDTATNVYPATWAAQTLALQYATGDAFTISNVTTNPAGAHIYRVASLPNVTTGLTSPLHNYYGVFLTDTTGNYDIGEDFSAFTNYCSANCHVIASRTHNAILSWTTINPNFNNNCSLTKTNESGLGVSYRAEYILATGTASVTVSTTSVSCNGGTDGTATASIVGGASPFSYTWSPSGSSASTFTTGAGNYTVTVADANGCSQSLPVTIIQPNPITVTTTNITACVGQATQLTAQAIGGVGTYSYTWNGIYTGQTYSITPTINSTYTVIATDANNCPSPASVVSVTLLAPLHVSIGDTSACAGHNVTISANASGGDGNYTFNWMPGDLVGIQISVSAQQTTIYTVTVSDGCTANNASDTGAVIIITNNVPVLNLPPAVSGCPTFCVNFSVPTYTNINTWLWNFGDHTTSILQNPQHCYNQPGNYNVSLTYSTTQGCSQTIKGNNLVTVFNMPQASFTSADFYLDELSPTISFINQSPAGAGYQWNFGDNAFSLSQNPSHIYSSVGDFPVSLTVVDSRGCKDTVTHIVHVKEAFSFYAPNCFTPNADHLNEHFLPLGTGWDIASFNLLVFDRWGNKVFTSKDYTKGWDGKISEKQDAVLEDIFVWKVELKDNRGKPHQYSGVVSVIK